MTSAAMPEPVRAAARAAPARVENTALHAKLRAARAQGQGAVSPETLAETQALALAVARAGRRALGCDLSLSGHSRSETEDLEAVAAFLDGPPLLCALESATRPGAVALDAGALAAVVALRTTGRIGAELVVPDRAATEIEAALLRPLLGAILEGWRAALGAEAAAVLVSGLRVGARSSAARALALALPEARYRLWTLSLDIEGTPRGDLRLALPVSPAPPRDAGPGAEEGWAEQFRAAVLEGSARLEAELHRMPLSLGALRALAPGTLLALPESCLSEVALRGPGGHLVAHGRLGQWRGDRAIRVSLPAAGAPSAPARPSDPAQAPGPPAGLDPPPPAPPSGPEPPEVLPDVT